MMVTIVNWEKRAMSAEMLPDEFLRRKMVTHGSQLTETPVYPRSQHGLPIVSHF